MPNIKSAKKRVKQAGARQSRNYNVRTSTKKAIRAVNEAIKAGDKKLAEETLQVAYTKIDISAKKKVMPKNTANRRKSLLARNVAGITAKKTKKADAPKKTTAKKAAPKKKTAKKEEAKEA